MSDLLIKIEGKEYLTWTTFYLKKSLEEVAHSFNFSVKAGAGIHKIQKHDDVKILFGGKSYTAGRIDKTIHTLSKDSNVYSYAGRSYVRDLIDSSATAHYEGWYLTAIFDHLCAIYHVPYDKPDDVKTSIVKKFALTAESPWQKMVAEALNQGLIFTSDLVGGVILGKASSEKLPAVLEEGVNFQQMEEEADGSSQFSAYTVRSGDRQGQVLDPDIGTKFQRPLDIYIDRETMTGELKKRAEMEMKRGQSKKYRITLGSWKYAEGKYWDVNYQVKVKSPTFELDKYLLITQVEFFLRERRKHVVLTLEEKELYE